MGSAAWILELWYLTFFWVGVLSGTIILNSWD